MRVLGTIIAGGQSQRMGGGEKAFAVLHGITMIERVISRIAFQVDDVVINANGAGARFAHLGRTVIADALDVRTPLAGLHAVLAHARSQGFDAVLTVPSDTPFLPLDLVARLSVAGAATGAAVAMSCDQRHHLTGLWSTAMAEVLEHLLAAKRVRRMMDLGDHFEIATADWGELAPDPFFNVNSPDDLKAAEACLGH